MKKTLLIIYIFVFTLACNNSDNDKDKTSKDVKEVCALVTEAEIKGILGIPEEAASEIEEADPTYPTCFYTWESVTFIKIMNIAGTDLELPYPAKATLVSVKNANETMYNASIKVYKEAETVSGIGDMATWGPNLSQLTFVAKGHMMHVNVQVSADTPDNKEKAIKLAKLIIERL